MRFTVEQPDHRRRSYDSDHCRLTIEQHGTRLVVLKIFGTDVGEFGDAPMATLDKWLAGVDRVELFIDARDVRGATIDVSGEWAIWLGRKKAKFQTVTMLTGSRFIHITAEFVRRFAELDGIMRICTEPGVFDDAIRAALAAR
jgi:hypothetical protein